MAKKKTGSKKKRRRSRERLAKRICDRCGTENPASSTECQECGSDRFAPEWVKKLERVNRNFAVQVTTSSPQDGSKPQDRISLYKWWPGGNSSFNINTAAQWNQVREIVETRLAPYLGWKSREEVLGDIKKREKDAQAAGRQIRSVAKHDPEIITQILKDLKLNKITDGDYAQISKALEDIAAILVNADESLLGAIRDVVKRLPTQGKQAIDQLAELMETLTLRQITALTIEANRRLQLIKTFRERAMDERSYEIKGDGSIHRFLEGAMWIIDEHFWLMHSNQTLRTVIGDEIEKRYPKQKRKRPDFVCGSLGNQLIIVELKRPSHSLTVEDLNQLELYLTIIEEHQGTAPRRYRAILIGKKMNAQLKRTIRYRSGFDVMTFSDLIDDAERRYKEFLKAGDR